MISRFKDEPEWMRAFRHEALDIFLAKPMPRWGDQAALHVDRLRRTSTTTCKSSEGSATSWDDVPDNIKRTFDRLGIPEAERKFLAGVTAQYESEVVYHSIHEELTKQGVIFRDMDIAPARARGHRAQALRHGDPVRGQQVRGAQQRRLVGRLVHLRAAGRRRSTIPLQAYFRINAENMGQFERTLIIADEGVVGALHRGLHGADLHHQLACTRRWSS